MKTGPRPEAAARPLNGTTPAPHEPDLGI